MTRSPQRLQVKVFLSSGQDGDVTRFVPLFHRWIQTSAVEDLLVDVHNYSHIHEGPGILLVGYEGDYAMDESGGRRGLLYRLKRDVGNDLPTALGTAIRRVVKGALLVEADGHIGGDVAFAASEFEIQLLDRLRFPNGQHAFEQLQSDLSSVMRSMLSRSDGSLTIERIDNDTREPLALRVLVANAPALSELIQAPEVLVTR